MIVNRIEGQENILKRDQVEKIAKKENNKIARMK